MWHIDAEIISLIFMFVIYIDVSKSYKSKTLKNRLFFTLVITTLGAIIIDIISTYAMMNYTTTFWWIIQLSLIIYFILTPLLSMLWQLYAIAVVEKKSKYNNVFFIITVLPFIIYFLIVCSNPFTGWMFTLNSANIYSRGILFNSMYVIFYGYSISTLLLSLFNYKKIERTTNIVLTVFPIVAGAGVYLQQLLPGYLITGASFTLVLLITYMFLQNRKATRDNLTGLNNRLSFITAIEKLSSSSSSGFLFTAALDDFKLFNQTFGQNNGDQLLCRVASYFIEVSPDNLVYRYGGDMFSFILKEADEETVALITAKIFERFKHPFYIDNVGYSISVCLGVVQYPSHSIEKNHSIVTSIDFAIYQAKKRGKGQIAFFDSTLVNQFKRKHEIAKTITDAIKNNTFEVYFQPIYHTQHKKFIFAEALLRLNDPNLGSIAPSEFIPIMEETGQIVECTYLVLDKVCAFLSNNRSLLNNHVAVSVNFSIVHLTPK